MLIFLYQFIFYAYLSCFTLLKSVLSLLHYFYVYNKIQGSLDHSLYTFPHIVGYLLCIYCVSMYI